MSYHFGIVWDAYTPPVEAQLTRDLIVIKNKLASSTELVCCCESSLADRVLNSFGIIRMPPLTLATTWILYSVTPDTFIEAPEWATTVVKRDLEVTFTKPNIRDVELPGYYLAPGDRPAPPRNLQMPSINNTGNSDPSLFLIWG